jgi:enamine deaminase RidA (YjgF/YER057c/UK114 family)
MSIIRHEIRQISDENRGQPIISQAVVHGNLAYFAGITPNPIVGDIKTQTAQVRDASKSFSTSREPTNQSY